MPGFGRLKRAFVSAMKPRLRALGYKKLLRDFSDRYAKKTASGYHGICCKTDARYDLSVDLTFWLHFDIVADVEAVVEAEFDRRHPELFHLDAKEMAYYLPYRHNFQCPHDRLFGRGCTTTDTIESESELDALIERTMARMKTDGFHYFENYGTIEQVLRVVDADSSDWRLLALSRDDFIVAAAETLFAVRGHKALVDYFDKHSQDPNLGDYRREQIEILIALGASGIPGP